MEKINSSMLLEHLKRELNALKRLKADDKDRDFIIEKSRAFGYLINVASTILKVHDQEKELAELRKAVERIEERRGA